MTFVSMISRSVPTFIGRMVNPNSKQAVTMSVDHTRGTLRWSVEDDHAALKRVTSVALFNDF